MNIKISKIQVAERIRKEAAKIDELAEDIKANGLLNPITVMPLDSGKYQLLAGLRRLKACTVLGMKEIMVNCVPVSDAEHALRIEFSENEQRENFTFSEKMDFARLIEEIEKAKARERMSIGGKGGSVKGVDCSPHLKDEMNDGFADKGDYNPVDNSSQAGRTRTVVGEKIGISGRQYDRAKYIAANAPPEIIRQIDEGKLSIRKAYDSVKKETDSAASSVEVAQKKNNNTYEARVRGISEERLKCNPHYAKLKADYETARSEANRATVSMHEMEMKHKNQIYHLESINNMLKRRVESLEAALTAANEQILELGGVADEIQQA